MVIATHNVNGHATAVAAVAVPVHGFPSAAGVMLGLGLGGLFDGIVLHQLLQWHHMLSSWYPPTTLANLRLNTRWDGIFHSATYVCIVVAVYLLWRAAQVPGRMVWPLRSLWGSGLLGFGVFNLVEGTVDHYLLGIHHVNEQALRSDWPFWDAGFLAWGAAMAVVGWLLMAAARRSTRAA